MFRLNIVDTIFNYDMSKIINLIVDTTFHYDMPKIIHLIVDTIFHYDMRMRNTVKNFL